jgi:hypothetical protein
LEDYFDGLSCTEPLTIAEFGRYISDRAPVPIDDCSDFDPLLGYKLPGR